MERDREREFLLLLSLLVLRFDLVPTGEGDREYDLERLSERAGDLSLRGERDIDFEWDRDLSRDPLDSREEPRAERGEPLGERECDLDLDTDLLREPDLPRLDERL